MKNSRWLKISLLATAFTLAAVVALNIFIDTYGIYTCLYKPFKKSGLDQEFLLTGFNQRIYNTELILRNHDRYDSFLFGSSLVGVISVGDIKTGNFFNMSYPQGNLAEHVAIIKTFIKNDIKIKQIVIGLDEYSFEQKRSEHQKQLLMIMHPEVSGQNRASVFFKYFLRMPRPFELSAAYSCWIEGNDHLKIKVDRTGLNQGWRLLEREITATEKLPFSGKSVVYQPHSLSQKSMEDTMNLIEELKAIAAEHHFSVILFFNPVYAGTYANYAAGLLPIKEQLAKHSNFIDFSGFNTVTQDASNYYEEFHYRYKIGNMILKRIFNIEGTDIPANFGVLVTNKNVIQHVSDERRALEQYLLTARSVQN